MEIKSRLIATKRISLAPNDKQELLESVNPLDPVIQGVEAIFVDSGFVSEAAIGKMEAEKENKKSSPTLIALC